MLAGIILHTVIKENVTTASGIALMIMSLMVMKIIGNGVDWRIS